MINTENVKGRDNERINGMNDKVDISNKLVVFEVAFTNKVKTLQPTS